MSLNWSIETYERLSSTQDEMKARLAPGGAQSLPPEGLVIQAIEQSAGRGRQGRLWFSPPGNLYISLLLRPACSLAQAGALSLVISYSLARALESLCGPDAGFVLKWPNDVLLEGRKCAGILLETETGPNGALHYVIAGIGVNLVSAPPETGIALGAAHTIALADLRDAVLDAVREDYNQWRVRGFAPFREKWLRRAFAPGTEISVGADKAKIAGTFKTVDHNGNLVMTDAQGRERTLASGEILQT